MRWSDVVTLVNVSYTQNTIGDKIEVESKTDVYANKKSIRQSEFYQAMATGFKPEIMFEIRSLDYANQKKLIFNTKLYTIIRAFDKNGEITELICTGLVI